DFPGGVRLGAHIDGGFLLLTDVDRDEPPDLMSGRSRAHAHRDAVENAVSDWPAVQEPIVDHGSDIGTAILAWLLFQGCSLPIWIASPATSSTHREFYINL